MQTFNSVVKLSFLFLSSFTCCPSCEGSHHPSIRITGNKLIGSQIVINCSMTAKTDLFAFEIIKDGDVIARNDFFGKIYLNESLKGRGSVDGKVTKRKANLLLKINEIQCRDDTGKYTCQLNTDDGEVQSEAVSLTPAVKPESVHITSEVKEETMLQLTCMGNIGNPSGDFSWHLCNETNCMPLTGNNIKLGDIEKVPGSCQYYGNSTLTFNHSKESSPFYIQCLVSYHNDGASYNVIALKRFDYSDGSTYTGPVVVLLWSGLLSLLSFT